ncbi:MAG: thiamine pyrophosphate-dependent enzyme [Candidatus Pacearchaeota archaeon]
MVRMKKTEIKSNYPITWCPGCPNFLILEAVKRAVEELIKEGQKQEDFCIVTDIGCNSKIYDYLNLSGVYGLHGRAVPLAEGIKLGNPKLKVIAFQGDGGAYAEGIEHLVHVMRHNTDITLVVHNNEAFSLTTGQITPTSPFGKKTKNEPTGNKIAPLNPIKLALSLNTKFIARCNPYDIEDTKRILKKAILYEGFSFVEIIQKCLIFSPEMTDFEKNFYKIEDNKSLEKAWQLADEWDYSSKDKKIAIGILFEA